MRDKRPASEGSESFVFGDWVHFCGHVREVTHIWMNVFIECWILEHDFSYLEVGEA